MADETKNAQQQEKIITLSILTHYDEKLKTWVLAQVTGGDGSDIEEMKSAIQMLQESQDLIII